MEEMKKERSIEESLGVLEELISKLESKDCPLEEAFAIYKEGVGIVEDCNKALKKVEDQLILLNAEA